MKTFATRKIYQTNSLSQKSNWRNPQDLSQRSILLRQNSSHWRILTVHHLLQSFLPIKSFHFFKTQIFQIKPQNLKRQLNRKNQSLIIHKWKKQAKKAMKNLIQIAQRMLDFFWILLGSKENSLKLDQVMKTPKNLLKKKNLIWRNLKSLVCLKNFFPFRRKKNLSLMNAQN